MMREFTLGELAQAVKGELRGGDASVRGVTIDSRRVEPGDLFVALPGARVDGHDFLDAVAAAGAVAAVVSRDVETTLPIIRVGDTRQALADLAAHNRRVYSGTLVGITGSSGKTTAKTLVAAVLSRGGETLATEGNLNNEIGVPLTLLRLKPSHRFAVVEMGAGRRGDIGWLCDFARPDVALLLNAMPAHLEGFGTLEDVVEAKGEIYQGLRGQGTAIINADQPWAARWRARAQGARILDYALEGTAAIRARDIRSRGMAGSSFIASTPEGDTPVRLALPGRHNVSNALAAMAIGLACGLGLAEITAGLAEVRPVTGRGALSRGPRGCTLVDDTYNANPGSVRAAIDLLTDCAPRRWLALGAMLELGSESERMHREIGEYAREQGLEAFVGVGEALRGAVDVFGDGGQWFADCGSAVVALRDQLQAGDTLVIKGSRGSAMERLLTALAEDSSEAGD